MSVGSSIVEFSIRRPKLVTWVMVGVAMGLLLLAALPTLWPHTFSALHPMKVDTDPENMLSRDEAVRVFHNRLKREMSIYDMVVLGVVNEAHPDGVFNPESLRKIFELTEFAKTLRWPDEKHADEYAGVVEVDLIAPSTVDNIEQGGLGVVKFEWLMASPPKTPEEALAIRRKAERVPFLEGTLLSEDGKAIALYLPLTSKDLSHKVYTELLKKISTLSGDERYFITGLPVAEDTFGVEMFKQMAISAPIAMLVIFLLMFFFFRKLILIASPLIVALVSVVCTMGLLVVTGNTIHIMSSMIPIFIMPIAVLDAVHILSEFFDRYQETKDRRRTIIRSMETLFTPMLYTSLTTAAGFASLALTPIPPVQVFGLFVTFGVLTAWALTVTFIPAFIMFVPEGSLDKFGLVHHEEEDAPKSALARLLLWFGPKTYRHAKLILAGAGVVTIVAVYGISRIQINDNPTKWFTPSHPIRVADRVLNDHFGGTYMAYLVLEPPPSGESPKQYVEALGKRLEARLGELGEVKGAEGVFRALGVESVRLSEAAPSKEKLLDELESFASEQSRSAKAGEALAWDEALLFIDEERQRDQVFKQPEALAYIGALQEHLLTTGVVGKSNSLADIVKTVHRELLLGDPAQFSVPDSAKAVAQTLITFQSGHRPQDLWHMVTPDFRKASIWVQLKSGDNKDMAKVARAVEAYIGANPPPFNLRHDWFGLTYINVVWQEKMVSGMLESFLGSFLVVFLMMVILFRSALWGLLSMIPLTVTIGLIYGSIGLIGKDYDMPVAVLSSLSLGLAVDYAIHFLSRGRELHGRLGRWSEAVTPMFGEPARAISRNVVVIGVGFLPLLAAPLVPYKTVGTFIAAILLTAGAATLLLLPALMTLLERWAFPSTAGIQFACNCGTCIVGAVAAVALVAVNVHQFFSVGWTTLTWYSIGAVLVFASACYLMSYREKCRRELSA